MIKDLISKRLAIMALGLICINPVNAAIFNVTSPTTGPQFLPGVVNFNTTSNFRLQDRAIVNSRFLYFDESIMGTLVGVNIEILYSMSADFGRGITDAPSYPASISGSVDVTQQVLLGLGDSTVFESAVTPLATFNLDCTISDPSLKACPIESAKITNSINLSFDQTSPFLSMFTLATAPNQLDPTWVTSLRVGMLLDPDLFPDIDYAMSMNLNKLESIEYNISYRTSEIPIPAAFLLFSTALVGLVGFSKRRQAA